MTLVEERGWVRRPIDARNKRRMFAVLTKDGLKALRDHDLVAVAGPGLGDDDVEVVGDVVDRTGDLRRRHRAGDAPEGFSRRVLQAPLARQILEVRAVDLGVDERDGLGPRERRGMGMRAFRPPHRLGDLGSAGAAVGDRFEHGEVGRPIADALGLGQ